MIKSLRISNFRSIQREEEFELAPITLLYGANGTGKSSLLYATLAFRNIVLNPNRPPDALFNLGVVNLGGFQQVVFDHRNDLDMVLGITIEQAQMQLRYAVSVGMNKGEFTLQAKGDWSLKMPLTVAFPYPSNSQVEATLKVGDNEHVVSWNGLVATLQVPSGATPEVQEEAHRINVLLNSPAEMLRRLGFVSVRRGFFKPQYQSVPISPDLVGEDEVASLIAQDPYLPGKLSVYLTEITDREFRTYVPLGTTSFYPQTVERSSGLTTELVNDGFGTNQLVYFLAKALRSETRLICAEEPEINLHPTSVRKLAQAMTRMIKEEEKQFLVSTHSETLVLGLLSQVAKGQLEPKDLRCYLATKRRKATRFERQDVNETGQIEGGLKSFVEAELADLKAFLGA